MELSLEQKQALALAGARQRAAAASASGAASHDWVANLPELDNSHGGSVVSGMVKAVGGGFDAAHKVAIGELKVPTSFQGASPEEAEAVIAPMVDAASVLAPGAPAAMTAQGMLGVPRAAQPSVTTKLFGEGGAPAAARSAEPAAVPMVSALPGAPRLADGSFTPEAQAAIQGIGLDHARLPPELAAAFEAKFAAKGASPAAAREAMAESLPGGGVRLSKGDATRDFGQQQTEAMLARGGEGDAASALMGRGTDPKTGSMGFRAMQDQDIAAAKAAMGEKLAGDQPVISNPLDAGQAVADAARSIHERAAGVEGVALNAADKALATARGPTPADAVDAAEVVAKGIREKAAASKAGYQGKYDEVAAAPGEFASGTFDQLGASIKKRLSPDVVLDEKVTPAATRAIADMDNLPAILGSKDGAGPDMKMVDQGRKRLLSFLRGASTPEDKRAVREVLGQFDNHVETALDAGLFSGEADTLAKLKDARAAFAEHQRTFKPQGPGDDVGTAMRAIVDRNAQPSEVSTFLLGNALTGRTDRAVRVTDRLKGMFGADSPEWAAIQQAHIGQAAAGKTPEEISANIDKILTGPGRTLSSRILAPEQVNGLRAYQNAVKIAGAARESIPAWVSDMAKGGFNPQAVADHLLGGSASAGPLANSIKGVLGPNSPEIAAVRQALWQKAVSKVEGSPDDKGAQAITTGIANLLNGKGKQAAEAVFTPAERAEMDRFRHVMTFVTSIRGANPNSDTSPFMARALKQVSHHLGHVLGFLGLSHGPLGAAVGYSLGKVVDGAAEKIVAGGPKRMAHEAMSGAPMTYSQAPVPRIAWPQSPVYGAAPIPAIAFQSRRLLAGPKSASAQVDKEDQRRR